MNVIDKLKSRVPPPEKPFGYLTRAAWRKHQKHLGIQLPDEDFAFWSTYGSGAFRFEGVLTITLFNPLDRNFVSSILRLCALRWRTFEFATNDDPITTHIFFPDPRGLFPIGMDDLCNGLYLKFRKTPGKPTIVLLNRELVQLAETRKSFARFQLDLLEGKDCVDSWGDLSTTTISFIPFPLGSLTENVPLPSWSEMTQIERTMALIQSGAWKKSNLSK